MIPVRKQASLKLLNIQIFKTRTFEKFSKNEIKICFNKPLGFLDVVIFRGAYRGSSMLHCFLRGKSQIPKLELSTPY